MTGAEWVISCAVSIGIGVLIGYYLGRRELRKKEIVEDRIDPENAPHTHPVKRTSILQKVFAGIIAVVAVVMVVQASNAADRDRAQSEEAQRIAQAQSECNSQLYQAIDARAAANSTDTQLQQADNAALLELVTGLLALPPGSLDQANSVQEQLMLYRDKINASDQKRKINAENRANNPYPVPTCGQSE